MLVRDLRNGEVLHRLPTGRSVDPKREIGVGPVVSLVVKADGAVAWVADDYERTGFGPVWWDLYSEDRSSLRLLTSGTSISPHSLALTGSTLYWVQAERASFHPASLRRLDRYEGERLPSRRLTRYLF